MSNQQIHIQFPDGSEKAYQAGVLAKEVAQSISQSLYKEAVVCRVNDRLVDLTHPLQADCELTFYTLKDQEGLNVMRHSAAHVLAQALTRLYPDVKLTIGPVIENGFYYDNTLYKSIREANLNEIVNKMNKVHIIKIKIVRQDIGYAEARNILKDNPYIL
ncbi:TGS domain-containing protein [Staphylococcus haemolyticus]|uniref:TGS domain-containing protein n=1 Tax=Staphylococcus haemolyticus TaxID=1283 RepID=UPI0015D8B55D|nr:TGS domain-containing protein [Staphylococcus haemolyticus]